MLFSKRRKRTTKRGRVVFAQGSKAEGIYCMESGIALLSHRSEEGEMTVFGVVGPGECFGYRSYFADDPHGARASALSRCKYCFIPRDTFDALLYSNKELARSFLRVVARDQGPRHGPSLRNPQLSVRLRLIYLLALFRERFSVEQENGELLFDLPMTRRNIAAMIGTRPETLTRALGALEREGAILFDRHLIRVIDPHRLFDERARGTVAGPSNQSPHLSPTCGVRDKRCRWLPEVRG